MNFKLALSALAGLALVVAFQNCSTNKVAFDQSSANLSSTTGGPVNPPPPSPTPTPVVAKKNCVVDATRTVLHGNFSIFFKYKAGTTDCESMQVRICNDGVLSGSADYIQSSCKLSSTALLGQNPSTLSKCTLGNSSVEQGGRITAFKETQPAAGGACVAEIRECSATGLSGSFTADYCQIRPPSDVSPSNASATKCAKWSTVDGNSVCVPDGAMAMGFPEQIKAADGRYTIRYAYASKNTSTGLVELSAGSANGTPNTIPSARWSRERTVYDPASSAYFTVSQSAKSTTMAFSYNAYDSRIEMCRIQIEVVQNSQSVWMDSSGKAFACSQLIARGYEVIGAAASGANSGTGSISGSGTSTGSSSGDIYANPILNYNLNGARVRIVNNANNEPIAIAEKRLEF